MQHSKTQDTLVGFFVASGIAALFYMALQVSNLGSYSGDDSYTVIAHFQNSGGLKVKSPVSLAGVRIGRVSAIRLDKVSHESIVEMRIESQYNNLPSDSGVSIYTAGLLGEQYVSLDPGSSDEFLKDKSTIDITSSAIVLEEMIGKFYAKQSRRQIMSKLTLTEQSPGHFTAEGSLTFANIDQQTLQSFKFLKGMDSMSIDLAKLQTTDSAGLALMIEWIRLSRMGRVKLSFKNIPAQLLALAKLSGLDETEYFAIHTH